MAKKIYALYFPAIKTYMKHISSDIVVLMTEKDAKIMAGKYDQKVLLVCSETVKEKKERFPLEQILETYRCR